MDGANIAQTAGAAFTALAALAALLTVRQGRHETRIARAALEAETQPLLTDVPRGIFTEETEWREADGTTTTKRFDRSELSVGASGPELVASVSVPVRNVGNGPARLGDIVIIAADGATAPGWVAHPVLPPGEMTHVGFSAEPDDPDWGVAESVAMAYEDFDLVVAYADASGHPREAVRFHIKNGQHPHVAGRRWAKRASELR